MLSSWTQWPVFVVPQALCELVFLSSLPGWTSPSESHLCSSPSQVGIWYLGRETHKGLSFSPFTTIYFSSSPQQATRASCVGKVAIDRLYKVYKVMTEPTVSL